MLTKTKHKYIRYAKRLLLLILCIKLKSQDVPSRAESILKIKKNKKKGKDPGPQQTQERTWASLRKFGYSIFIKMVMKVREKYMYIDIS